MTHFKNRVHNIGTVSMVSFTSSFQSTIHQMQSVNYLCTCNAQIRVGLKQQQSSWYAHGALKLRISKMVGCFWFVNVSTVYYLLMVYPSNQTKPNLEAVEIVLIILLQFTFIHFLRIVPDFHYVVKYSGSSCINCCLLLESIKDPS